MTERRYTEEEVARILDQATETPTASGPGDASSTGMTLSELEEIGREVGIPADAIARAAADLDRPLPVPAAKRTFLGTTVGVGRTVELPRRLSDAEWNGLVVDLRMTFDAKGRIRQEGDFRQWTNGNLQALLEPTPGGERLRLRTVKGQAMPGMAVGSVMMAAAAGSVIATMLLGTSVGVADPVTLGAMGAALFAWVRIPLPGWARTREDQMDGIVQRVGAMVAADRIGPGDGDVQG